MSMIYGGSNVTFPDGTTQNTSPSGMGFKNRIINGAMMIDQRNAGASVTLTSGGAPTFAVDRFYGYYDTSATSVTNQQVTDIPTGGGFVNSLKWTTGTGGSATSTQQARLIQNIEGVNTPDLMWGSANAKPITISFWVKSSLTGTFSCGVSNNAGDRSYVATYTISSANTWEQKSITIAGDTTGTWLTTNAIGIRLSFDLGTGSNRQTTANTWAAGFYVSQSSQPNVIGTSGATFYITGVQLEKGSTATSFDYRPYGTELALCQRYYYRMIQTVAGTAWFALIGMCNTTTTARAVANFPVTMRTAPTSLETTGTATNYSVSVGGSLYTCNAIPSLNDTNTTNGIVNVSVASGFTVGYAAILQATSGTYLAWSAEL